MIAEGNYVATPIGGCFQTTKEGKLTMRIDFQFKEQPHRMFWVGHLEASDKAKEIAYRTIALLGFDESKDVTDGFGKEAFKDPKAEFELVVKHETYNGKTEAKVAFVNPPFGGSKYKAAPEVVNSKMGAFKASLAAAKATAGIDVNEEIPF